MFRFVSKIAWPLLAVALSSGVALADDAKPYAGQTVTVLLPPWGTLPSEMTDSFKAETGINLDMQTLGWEQIHSKVVTSMLAGTSPADVVEIDWSWATQFAETGWFIPLGDLLDAETMADVPTTKIFMHDGKIIGAPWNNDFRLLIVNKQHFDKAGIKDLPKTLDELLADAKLLKEKGISQYPIILPLSATEGTSTTWYLLTKAFGGDVFNKDGTPAFASPDSGGYKAFAWLISAVKDGLIDPGSTGLTDVQVQELFKSGAASIDFNGWVANLEVYNDPTKSKVAGQAIATTIPSNVGKERIFGLPEGVGIPAASEHKEAAAVAIKWLLKSETQLKMHDALGDLPTRTTVLSQLNTQGKFPVGPDLLAKIPDVEPFFPEGAPSWYPQFSTAVSSAINQAAKGQITVDEAIKQIAAKTTEIKQ